MTDPEREGYRDQLRQMVQHALAAHARYSRNILIMSVVMFAAGYIIGRLT